MSIQKRTYRSRKTGKESVTWEAWFAGADGQEKSKSFRLQGDAQKWLDTNRADIARGRWIDPDVGKVTFRAYAEAWLETKADVSERTFINIEGRIRNHAVPHFGAMQMSAIRPRDVRTFVSRLSGAGRAPETVKSAYLTVSQVFDQAVADDVIAKSPCVEIRLPRKRRGDEMHFLTAAQVNELAQAIDDRYRALILTAAYAGLRAGELEALQVGDLSLGELGGTIAVTKAASEVGGGLRIGTTKTGRSRVVTIPRFLSELLGDHVERFSSGYVFTAGEGGPIHHRNFARRHFHPAVEKARNSAIAENRDDEAIPAGLRFHDLRHTCAAILIGNGRHMEEVKDHLGHSSIRTTSDTYGHLFKSAKAALADALEATFQSSLESQSGGNREKSGIPSLRRVR